MSTPWPRRVFCAHSFRCCFFWEETVRVLPLSSINPRTNTVQWCTNMMAVKMTGLGKNFFSVCPTLNGAGLHILLCGCDGTVHRSEVSKHKPESKFWKLSSESSNTALLLATPDQCTPSEPMCVPFSRNSIGKDWSVSHFTRRLPGCAQGLWRERDVFGCGVERSAPCSLSHKT